jgi:hypothetical protein
MEDRALYPALVKHPKPEVQAKAKKFIDEMGGTQVLHANVKMANSCRSWPWPW